MANEKGVTAPSEEREETTSFFSSITSFFTPSVARAEEEEAEEEEEPEDLAPGIKDECRDSKACEAAKHHFEHCQERVEEGKVQFPGETCVEELFHLMHCVDQCAAPKIFSKLK